MFDEPAPLGLSARFKKLQKRDILFFLIISIGLLSVAGGVSLFFYSTNHSRCSQNVTVIEGVSAQTQGERHITVDVAGAVESPGLYSLPSDARLADALKKAGGVSKKADLFFVAKELNISKRLQDEGKVYVPFEGESLTSPTNKSSSVSKNTGSVSINSASLEELKVLSGIGDKRAEEIIENRPYSSLEDLEEKTDIPGSVIEKLRNQATL